MFGENGSGGQWTLKYTFNAMSFAASVDVIAFVTRYVFLFLYSAHILCTFVTYDLTHTHRFIPVQSS